MPQDLIPKDTTPVPGGSHDRHQIVDRMTHRGSLGIKAITFLNSLATGVLWNGLGFITSQEFHYSASQTYGLYIVTGAVYAFSALYCGRLVRRFERHVNARKVMMILFLIQVLVAPLIYVGNSSVGLIVIAIVTSFTGACLWPIIESYVAAGRSAQQTRKAIGEWCIVWMTSVSLALFLMAPLQQNEGWMNPRLALFAILPMSLLSMACLWFVPSHPGHHHAPAEEAPADYNS
ncbi:MAG: MFS transporter, partial [Planctomycetota bacterium]